MVTVCPDSTVASSDTGVGAPFDGAVEVASAVGSEAVSAAGASTARAGAASAVASANAFSTMQLVSEPAPCGRTARGSPPVATPDAAAASRALVSVPAEASRSKSSGFVEVSGDMPAGPPTRRHPHRAYD